MQTVDKAFTLLKLFSTTQPEIGLSELARQSGFDKAATRRFLLALEKHQFIEQNLQTKAYRLGAGFLRYSQIREEMFPIQAVVKQSLERLTQLTRETCHGSMIIGDTLSTVGVCLSERSNRVHISAADELPLNATASGFAYMAFSGYFPSQNQLENLSVFTNKTLTEPDDLHKKIQDAKRLGYSMVQGHFEEDVTGVAVPIFSSDQTSIGALAVASPSSRMSQEHIELICGALFQETEAVSTHLGGQLPTNYQQLIDARLAA